MEYPAPTPHDVKASFDALDRQLARLALSLAFGLLLFAAILYGPVIVGRVVEGRRIARAVDDAIRRAGGMGGMGSMGGEGGAS